MKADTYMGPKECMKVNIFGRIYIAIMSVYFVVSGFNALLDVDAKLARIGLAANDLDGKVAFILIYCSLMIGIGIAITLIAFMSKTWVYSAVLATTIICSFILFRLIGSFIVGEMTSVQLSFILVEVIEASIGLLLLSKSKNARAC